MQNKVCAKHSDNSCILKINCPVLIIFLKEVKYKGLGTQNAVVFKNNNTNNKLLQLQTISSRGQQMAVIDLNLKRHSTPINRNASRERLLVYFSFRPEGFSAMLIYAHPDLQPHENFMISFSFLSVFFCLNLVLTEIPLNLPDREHMTRKGRDTYRNRTVCKSENMLFTHKTEMLW